MRLVSFFYWVLLWLCLTSVSRAQEMADLVVVANIDHDLQLSKREARNLFMGANLGHDLEVVSLPKGHLARVTFNTRVVGMTESRIQGYWAQMRFSGRRTPPRELADVQSIINYLRETPGAVSYLPASSPIPDNLTVLFTTN